MKVAVKNPNDKPVNISRLAPLMPVMVLGVNQEIIANVRDIESVTKNAKKIGVTVTPVGEAFKVAEQPEDIVETTKTFDESNLEKPEKGNSEEIVDKPSETPIETNENTPEMENSSEDNTVVEEETKPKSKRGRKSARAKKIIIGNNK